LGTWAEHPDGALHLAHIGYRRPGSAPDVGRNTRGQKGKAMLDALSHIIGLVVDVFMWRNSRSGWWLLLFAVVLIALASSWMVRRAG